MWCIVKNTICWSKGPEARALSMSGDHWQVPAETLPFSLCDRAAAPWKEVPRRDLLKWGRLQRHKMARMARRRRLNFQKRMFEKSIIVYIYIYSVSPHRKVHIEVVVIISKGKNVSNPYLAKYPIADGSQFKLLVEKPNTCIPGHFQYSYISYSWRHMTSPSQCASIFHRNQTQWNINKLTSQVLPTPRSKEVSSFKWFKLMLGGCWGLQL